MNTSTIYPINDHHLIQLDERNEGRVVHLGSKRSISAVRDGLCIRSERFEGRRVRVCGGGIPITDRGDVVMVRSEAIVSVDGALRQPYVHIVPEEVGKAGSIWTPEIYYSGWYTVIDVFDEASLAVGDRVLPIYGEPRLSMEDDSEYCHIDAIGVVEVEDGSYPTEAADRKTD